jgi:uncharacterized protein (TIGR03437 family)
MRRSIALSILAGCLALGAEEARKQAAPSYSVSSVVNSVSYSPAALAPYTPVTIFGTELSFSTAQITAGQSSLPVELAGVAVTVRGLRVPLFYVSETQINLLLPAGLEEGQAPVRVVRLGVSGPEVIVRIDGVAPSLFRTGLDLAIATHADGSLITREAAARASEVIVIYAAGLGPTATVPPERGVPAHASELVRLRDLRVLLDGTPVDPSLIRYAGLTPLSAGLYQVNLQLPERVGTDPEIRLSIGDQSSAAGIRLAVR